VFRLAPDGTETLLYSFTGEEDDYGPQSTPIVDGKGRLYATAAGVYNGGTIFRLPEQARREPAGGEHPARSFAAARPH
jgi:hypothetical protein